MSADTLIDRMHDLLFRIDMDAVAAAIVALGVAAEVYHSGGGCATIGVGPVDAEDRFVMLAGPGAYSTTEDVPSVGWIGDFYYGPDDDGVTPALDATTADPADLAAAITTAYRTIRPTD